MSYVLFLYNVKKEFFKFLKKKLDLVESGQQPLRNFVATVNMPRITEASGSALVALGYIIRARLIVLHVNVHV